MAKAGGGAGRAFPGAAPKKTKDYTDRVRFNVPWSSEYRRGDKTRHGIAETHGDIVKEISSKEFTFIVHEAMGGGYTVSEWSTGYALITGTYKTKAEAIRMAKQIWGNADRRADVRRFVPKLKRINTKARYLFDEYRHLLP